ncbi:MAG: hypothetical protein ACRDI2_20895 [Chloroflexota bacterium]
MFRTCYGFVEPEFSSSTEPGIESAEDYISALVTRSVLSRRSLWAGPTGDRWVYTAVTMRLALFSDVHGNPIALDAVLADIAAADGVDG